MADSEATLWVKSEFRRPMSRPMVWDEAKNRFVKATNEDGTPRYERGPQVGFVGNDLKNLKSTPMRLRAWKVLTKEGNEIDIPLTEAAAVQASDAQMAAVHKRCNQLGRIRVGTCPIREVYSGLRASSLVAPLNRAADVKPCSEAEIGHDDEGRPLPPCPHYLAEKKARGAVQFAKNAEQNEKFIDPGAKQLAAQQGQIDALNQVAASTAALVDHLVAKDAAPAPPTKGPAGK